MSKKLETEAREFHDKRRVKEAAKKRRQRERQRERKNRGTTAQTLKITIEDADAWREVMLTDPDQKLTLELQPWSGGSLQAMTEYYIWCKCRQLLFVKGAKQFQDVMKLPGFINERKNSDPLRYSRLVSSEPADPEEDDEDAERDDGFNEQRKTLDPPSRFDPRRRR